MNHPGDRPVGSGARRRSRTPVHRDPGRVGETRRRGASMANLLRAIIAIHCCQVTPGTRITEAMAASAVTFRSFLETPTAIELAVENSLPGRRTPSTHYLLAWQTNAFLLWTGARPASSFSALRVGGLQTGEKLLSRFEPRWEAPTG